MGPGCSGGGLASLPSAALSFPSPAAASVEEAEPWHRCRATPVSAPAEGGAGQGTLTPRFKPGQIWPVGCCTLEHPYHTAVTGVWAWQC